MADELKARQVFIDKSQLPSLESGDFYWNDLIGMQVKSSDTDLLRKCGFFDGDWS